MKFWKYHSFKADDYVLKRDVHPLRPNILDTRNARRRNRDKWSHMEWLLYENLIGSRLSLAYVVSGVLFPRRREANKTAKIQYDHEDSNSFSCHRLTHFILPDMSQLGYWMALLCLQRAKPYHVIYTCSCDNRQCSVKRCQTEQISTGDLSLLLPTWYMMDTTIKW